MYPRDSKQFDRSNYEDADNYYQSITVEKDYNDKFGTFKDYQKYSTLSNQILSKDSRYSDILSLRKPQHL